MVMLSGILILEDWECKGTSEYKKSGQPGSFVTGGRFTSDEGSG
jgi:hypothetical protein